MALPRASSFPLLHVVLIFLSLLCFASSYCGVLAAGDASQGAESASASPSCNLTSQDVNPRSHYHLKSFTKVGGGESKYEMQRVLLGFCNTAYSRLGDILATP
ncbi:hypothetical protein BHM03_00021132 [Ensete ventricosum]|nr:hypothetical protein BHM03_00021132 [Ensete ventricosum]